MTFNTDIKRCWIFFLLLLSVPLCAWILYITELRDRDLVPNLSRYIDQNGGSQDAAQLPLNVTPIIDNTVRTPIDKIDTSSVATVAVNTSSSVGIKVPTPRAKSSEMPLQVAPKLPTWKPGSFCDKFVEHSFGERIPMCGPKVMPNDSVECWKNGQSTHMARCSVKQFAMNSTQLAKRFFNCDACKLKDLDEAWFLDTGSCSEPTFSALDKAMDGEYQRTILHEILSAQRRSSNECKKWVDNLVFLVNVPHRNHIYFRFLGYYNLHKAILELAGDNKDFLVLRLTNAPDYNFPDYEKKLFPQLITINDLPDTVVCFSKVVFVPHTFSATPFRCKMESSTRGPCYKCDGRKLYGTSLMSFRRRVLSACSLADQSPEERSSRSQQSLVMILRKAYKRFEKDSKKNFRRVLANQDSVVDALKQAFPSTTITTVHMEDLGICEQISVVHGADVLVGVHGAGLVHSWWLQEDALLFELVPSSQLGNPSFKMLTTLAGIRYFGFTISSGDFQVKANPRAVVDKLKEVSNLK